MVGRAHDVCPRIGKQCSSRGRRGIEIKQSAIRKQANPRHPLEKYIEYINGGIYIGEPQVRPDRPLREADGPTWRPLCLPRKINSEKYLLSQATGPGGRMGGLTLKGAHMY